MHALEKSRLFTEEHCGKILLATMGKPKDVYELSNLLGIPIAVCYRKIKQLEDSGIIVCAERRLTQEGKRISLFKSNVNDAEIVFHRNEVRAKVEIFDGSIQEVTCDIDMPTLFVALKKTV